MADFSFILDYISANFEFIVPRRTHRDGSLMLAKVNLDIDSNLMLSISIKYLNWFVACAICPYINLRN